MDEVDALSAGSGDGVEGDDGVGVGEPGLADAERRSVGRGGGARGELQFVQGNVSETSV